MVWSSDLIWAAWRGMIAAVEWLMTCCRGACCAAEDGMGFADNLLHTLIHRTKKCQAKHKQVLKKEGEKQIKSSSGLGNNNI
jgi:hypothetical protein